jgi:hypothetical protein
MKKLVLVVLAVFLAAGIVWAADSTLKDSTVGVGKTAVKAVKDTAETAVNTTTDVTQTAVTDTKSTAGAAVDAVADTAKSAVTGTQSIVETVTGTASSEGK